MGNKVEMFRDAIAPNGRNRFSCSLQAWEFLQELAETFGWRPKGTLYIASPKAKIEAAARHNYQPGNTLDPKCIEADDAMAMAHALDVAKRSAHFDAMIAARTGIDSQEPLPVVIDEFVHYAYGGAFTFAISADASD
jgi:hypothetical protein